MQTHPVMCVFDSLHSMDFTDIISYNNIVCFNNVKENKLFQQKHKSCLERGLKDVRLLMNLKESKISNTIPRTQKVHLTVANKHCKSGSVGLTEYTFIDLYCQTSVYIATIKDGHRI